MLACVCLRAAVRNYSPGRLDWLNPAHEKIFIVILISIAILILDRGLGKGRGGCDASPGTASHVRTNYRAVPAARQGNRY